MFFEAFQDGYNDWKSMTEPSGNDLSNSQSTFIFDASLQILVESNIWFAELSVA